MGDVTTAIGSIRWPLVPTCGRVWRAEDAYILSYTQSSRFFYPEVLSRYCQESRSRSLRNPRPNNEKAVSMSPCPETGEGFDGTLESPTSTFHS
jgi:hypothetical protein